MIEYVEDDVDELPGSDFAKSTARVFDKIYNGESGVLPLSNFFYFIETLGGGRVIVRIWKVVCGN